MSEKRNTIPPNSATVLNEPLNETAVQVVDPAPDPEAPTNVDEPIAGDILESALPTASSASSIAHLRALNTSGESVNIAPNSIADLALRTANKTKVQTLAGMDYSLLTEQIVHGEYCPHLDTGKPLQVYVRTFKGTFPNTLGMWTSDTNHIFRYYYQLASGFNSTKGFIECIGVVGIDMPNDVSYKGAVYQLSRSNGGIDITCNQATPEAFIGKIFYITLKYTKA